MNPHILIAALIAPGLLALGGGCNTDDQTGIPQPFPLPREQSIRSSGLMPGLEEQVRVIGLPETVPGAGKISIVNGDRRVEVDATAAGTFSASILARAKDLLAIRFETSEPATIEVAELGIMVPQPPGPRAGVPPLTGPAAGKVTLAGQASANVGVFALNVATGTVVTTTADGAGAFDLQIEAASGEALEVYEDIQPLGPAWALTIP